MLSNVFNIFHKIFLHFACSVLTVYPVTWILNRISSFPRITLQIHDGRCLMSSIQTNGHFDRIFKLYWVLSNVLKSFVDWLVVCQFHVNKSIRQAGECHVSKFISNLPFAWQSFLCVIWSCSMENEIVKWETIFPPPFLFLRTLITAKQAEYFSQQPMLDFRIEINCVCRIVINKTLFAQQHNVAFKWNIVNILNRNCF